MNDNFLSQEEIDALVNKVPQEPEETLGEVEKDIIGEIGNISMSTAATTLSSILNKQVLITTPRVSWVSFEEIVKECKIPKVVTNIKFKNGLKGNNMLLLDVKDATIIADLMMGGTGETAKDVFSDLELSAVAEAMNQMIGSASTSMATMLGREIDISPPDIEVWNDNENVDIEKISGDKYVCKIAFDLTVSGLIDSEIMQIFTMESVEDIVNIMLGETDGIEAIKEEELPPIEEIIESAEYEEPLPITNVEPETKKVEVKKPVFQPLTPNTEERKSAPRNLDLIMDVPLEFSVVLGKSKKTIKEILSFNNGSIVELDKLADEPLEIYVNGKLIAHGEVVVVNENFGIRITNILTKEQRVQNLR